VEFRIDRIDEEGPSILHVGDSRHAHESQDQLDQGMGKNGVAVKCSFVRGIHAYRLFIDEWSAVDESRHFHLASAPNSPPLVVPMRVLLVYSV
jgi:hypothetical protein